MFREGLPSTKKKRMNEELIEYLVQTKSNIKSGSELLAKFLESVKDFEPAMRHIDLYHYGIRKKLIDIRNSVRSGVVFLDERMQNKVNTLNSIHNHEQLRAMVDGWISTIKPNDPESQGILDILEVEMWSDDRAKRNFPVPSNKILVIGYLISALNYFQKAKENLEQYIDIITLPDNV